MTDTIDKFSIMAIHKFQLDTRNRENHIAVPKGASILHLGVQNGVPTLWVLLDKIAEPVETIRIRHFGTGRGFPPGTVTPERYIGTTILLQDSYVLHFFLVDDWAIPYLSKNAQVANACR